MEHIAKLFYNKIKGSFDDYLKDKGFIRISSHANETGFSMIYRNEECYINIGASFLKVHHPYYFFFTLGEGSEAMPESDWNAIPLWRMGQSVAPDDYTKSLHIYDIPDEITEDQVAEKIQIARELCEKYCSDFLTGELELFKSIRKEQNKEREPHKIYVLDPDGQHKLTYEEQSIALKQMFS